MTTHQLNLLWSGAPAVKQKHQLRTGDPYSITRHPIYTGVLGMLLGSMLVAGGGRWIVRRFMLAEFPDDYPRYRQRVPRLVPGLRLISGSKARACRRSR
jgi:protein-S-isoprenylcysteine O-methyltransferase Ste14